MTKIQVMPFNILGRGHIHLKEEEEEEERNVTVE